MKSTLTIQLDAQDKEDFKRFCKSVGLTPSTAVRLFVKAILREQAFPFSLEEDPFNSPENRKQLEKNIREMEATGGKEHKVMLDDQNDSDGA